jgi:serine/threonine protein kinase
MAPEIIDCNTDGYGQSVDIWALGITIIELTQGTAPYYNETGMSAILKIIKNDPPKLSTDLFSTQLCNFVSSCLIKDPKYRATAK